MKLRLLPLAFLLALFSYSEVSAMVPDTIYNLEKPLTSDHIKGDHRKARRAYSNGKFEEAINYYNKLINSDSLNFDYNYEIGLTYYSMDNMKIRCIPYFERLLRITDPLALGDVFFFLGRSYHIKGEFEKAITAYITYVSRIESNGTFLSKSVQDKLVADVRHQVVMCENGLKVNNSLNEKIYVAGQLRDYTLKALSSAVNSTADDYSQILSPNDSLLYFTSRREGKKKKDQWDQQYFEDIFYSRKTSNGWSEAQRLNKSINTSHHDAPNFFSTDGKRVYLYRSGKKGTIYIAQINADGSWSDPQKFEEVDHVNMRSRETSLNYTMHDNTLYFVSERSGGYGGRDIYISKQDANGIWSDPINLGADVNSEYDEDAPYVSADGQTLYFSSNGVNSIGGYDIFYCVKENGKWSKPKSMGYPFNSPADDIYFTIDSKNENMYFSSSRVQNNFCDMNIYEVSTKCKHLDTAHVKGYLADRSLKLILSNPIDARVQQTVMVDESGNYDLYVLPGSTYRLTFVSEKLEKFSSDFEIPFQCKAYNFIQIIDSSSTSKNQEFIYNCHIQNAFFNVEKMSGTSDILANKQIIDTLDVATIEGYSEERIQLKTNVPLLASTKTDSTTTTSTNNIVKTEKIVFANILFDFDKSNVKEEFHDELQKLIAYLKNYPEQTIELSGHTDALGDQQYNIYLSQRRAKAVKNYLITKGVVAKRISISYFGEDKPVENNDTDEGRQFNRRVEIRLNK